MSELINKHGEAFKAIVLKQLLQIPESEWLRLRGLNDQQSPLPHEDAEIERYAVVTAEQLVQAALSDDSMPLEVLLKAFKNVVEIERLEGQPVYYFVTEGIYAWAPEPEPAVGGHLSVWVTHPAYPPGW